MLIKVNSLNLTCNRLDTKIFNLIKNILKYIKEIKDNIQSNYFKLIKISPF